MEKFKFKKKYGQNFLIDDNILNKIVGEINLSSEEDIILEIGAGSGNLTSKLKNKGVSIISYEIDLETKNFLSKLESDNLKIIYDDFLKRDIKDDIKEYNYNNIYVVGNLPYYITTSIIKKIIDSGIKSKEMLFMVQKEVAERLAAKPGNKDYGYITVYLNYFYDIDKLFDVSRNSFKPVPNVESSIIKLTSSNKYHVNDENKFNKLIKDSFQFKRKTLLNNLKIYNKEIIKSILINNNIDLSIRAEQIPIEIFIELSNAL